MNEDSCYECGRIFKDGEQFVYHETEGGGSVGGPWCLKCATKHFGYNKEDSHFEIHYAETGTQK